MLWPHLFSPEVVDPAVHFLAELAGAGRALELGIGTGRLAVPLSRRGISIHGIELSPAMVEQLHAEPGADAIEVSPEHVGVDEIDVATQNSWSHHYWFVDGEAKQFSAPFRYVWPSELDLMARLAGMALRERWSTWERDAFTSDDRSHISVWEKVE